MKFPRASVSSGHDPAQLLSVAYKAYQFDEK